MTHSPDQTAVVTGAGSGIGRAVAIKLAGEGWRVALIGRRRDALEGTRALAGPGAVACACDLADRAAVERMAAEVLARFGRVDALVNAAGTNTPRRAFAELDPAEYERVVATNLHGAFHCARLFLPAMRRQGGGTIVNINSEAGLRASAKSGAAYVVSKFGLTGLTQTINAEERAHGIRACSVHPGDVDTPLLDQRPVVPDAAGRAVMLQPSDVAACVWLAVSLPARAIVEELVVRPRCAP